MTKTFAVRDEYLALLGVGDGTSIVEEKDIVQSVNARGPQILRIAALFQGNADVVDLLVLELGCSPNIKVISGCTLLHHACGRKGCSYQCMAVM